MKKNNYFQFARSFIQQPKQVGSVWPSSRFLASKMIYSIPWHEVNAVAELGSGTGAITKFIKDNVTDGTHVFLFEMDNIMRSQLKTAFPRFHCLPNASRLVEDIQREGINQLDCVISGLPFFNFSPELRESLLQQIYYSLKPGGVFVAFQYSLQMKRHLSLKLEIERIEFVPLNFPPAFVYTCRKEVPANKIMA